MKIAGHKVVRVEWVDSSSRPGWQDLQKHIDLRVVSVGLLLHTSSDRIVLTKSIALASPDETRCYHSQMHIPRSAIKKLRYL
jgi:hypothetical protein